MTGELGSPSPGPGSAARVDVQVVLDTAQMTQALVPVEGGSVSATGSDGTVYTLDIPADALLHETWINMTPVASLTGMPFGGAQTYAVRMGPEGLSLMNFAVLTIAPSTDMPIDQQILFGYLADGQDVILAAPVSESSEIKINVLHFSGYGATNGSVASIDALRESLGGDTERSIQNALSASLQIERQRQLLETMGIDVEAEPMDPNEVIDAMRRYEEQVIKPRVDAAGESCDAGKLAVNTVLAYERQLQLLGVRTGNEPDRYPGLFDKMARACILEAFENCVEYHAWLEMLVVYKDVMFQSQFYSAGTLAEALDLTKKCVTFRLVLESTGKADYQGLANYESSVEGEVMLRWNPGTDLIGGHADYINTSVTGSMKIDCTVALTPGGGTLAVLGLVPIYEGGEPDGDGNYPDAGVKDLRLSYAVGPSTEHSVVTCPHPPGPPSVISGTAAIWSLAYYDAHIEEVDPDWDGLQDWEMEYDHLYATREWDLTGTTAGIAQSEAGSFELYHEPGG